MTRDELKEMLKSKENRLAGEAIAAIRAGAPLATLQGLVDVGAAQTFYMRDPAHPRSRFRTEQVLDACYETNFGVVSESTEERDGRGIHTAVLGEVHRSEGTLPHFRYLLSKGFTPGDNGYRGALFNHILKSCFRGERRENARLFARTLAEAKAYDIQRFADNDYAWVADPTAVDFLIELGADPKGAGMIDCALNYIGCSPNSSEAPTGRVDVVRKLLALGAVPKKDLRKALSWQHIREKLEECGLLETVSAFGVIDANAPQEYLDYRVRCGKSLAGFGG